MAKRRSRQSQTAPQGQPASGTVWHRHKKLLLAVGAVAGLIVGFGANLFGFASGIRSGWEGIFGRDDPHLVVTSARLVPWFSTVADPRQHDQLFLQLRLRNYAPQSIYLTAAELRVKDAHTGEVGIAGGSGKCTLTSILVRNHPIELEAGDEKWITISPAIRLPGIENLLSSSPFSEVTPIPSDEPVTIAEGFYADTLNAALAKLYGQTAAVEVSLFSGNKQKVRTLRFALASGKDVFNEEGALEHDVLLATWRARNTHALFPSGADCSP
jgi:hypothetical protein